MFCKNSVRNKIKLVFSHDGPGLRKHEFESSRYQKILPKLRSYVPKSSFVGMLLRHSTNYIVVDSKNKLNYSNENAVVDQNGNEGENHGYNNDPVNGINIIKLRLNPLSKEEYDLYFKSIFEDVYGINYSEVKKIAAKSLTTHKNTTTEIPDVSFYKSLKNAIGNMPDVEYENQMLDMEALTRLFYSYYTGEIQPAEESDLNQDWNELEQIRIENCSKVKSR